MSTVQFGMLMGAFAAFAWASVGFWAFVLVLVGAVVGAVVARILAGTLDWRELVNAFRGNRSSE